MIILSIDESMEWKLIVNYCDEKHLLLSLLHITEHEESRQVKWNGAVGISK